jgi:alkanesulfonate monooxygenase SsuD/methylene tetrahydromethanopterin reductase-like flavin-dependent oxidoreductase (luciferase family)
MANMLQKLALKLAEKLLAFAQQKAFGREDAFVYSRARVIVELDRIHAEAARKEHEFQAKLDQFEKEWKRQLRIASWATMDPTAVAKDRAALDAEDGFIEPKPSPNPGVVLQFSRTNNQQGGWVTTIPHRMRWGISFSIQ